MKQDSAQILNIKNTEKARQEYSEPFENIMQRWNDITVELESAFEQERTYKGQSSQHDLEAIYKNAGNQQRELFNAAAKLKALRLVDVFANLEFWKTTVCPTPDSEAQLSLTDDMILSAYRDLQNFMVPENRG